MTTAAYKRPAEDPRVAQTRDLVLRAARELLIAEGQEAVTPSRLTEMTGISRSTIYRHWADPTDIIFEATALDVERPPFAPTGDVATDLRSYLVALRSMLESDQGKLLATQMDRANHDAETDVVMGRITEGRRALIARVAQYTEPDFGPLHALLVGPLVFQRFMARQPISDELIDLVVETFQRANAV